MSKRYAKDSGYAIASSKKYLSFHYEFKNMSLKLKKGLGQCYWNKKEAVQLCVKKN